MKEKRVFEEKLEPLKLKLNILDSRINHIVAIGWSIRKLTVFLHDSNGTE